MEKRFKVYGSIFLTGIALLGTVLTTRGVHDSFLFDSRVNADNSYHLTLSKNNKYTSGTTKTITTDSGNYNVEFAYYNCSSMENGHATINNEGTIKNTDHILSIESITPVFTCANNASLKFRASYDAKKWGEYATLTSNRTFELQSCPYYIEVKAFGGAVNLTSLNFSYACSENINIPSGEPAWRLATSNDNIGIGKRVLIASYEDPYAMTDTNLNSGKKEIKTTKYDDGTIEKNSSMVEYTLVQGVVNNTYGFYNTSLNNYIYGATSATAALKSGSNLQEPSSFCISIASSGIATIMSNSTYSTDLRYIRYNYNSGYFICNEQDWQYDVSLYYYDEGTGVPKYVTGIDATDGKASSYHTGDVFDNFVGDNGLSVKVHYSDGSSETLTKSNYDYTIKTLAGSTVSSTSGFSSTGTFNVTITDKTFGFTYTYQILVANNPVTSISLNTSSLRLGVEETAQLSVTSILPLNADDKTITWTSSDDNVATVSANGLVTARSGGTAIITATANGGSGITASCTVKVSSAQGGGTETVNTSFDFTNINDFDDWGSSYGYHSLESDNGTVVFYSADHNTSTITNMPVTKGQPVEYIAPKDAIISAFSLVCEKWGTNNQIITLNTSTDYGQNYKSTSTTSSTFTLSNSNLDAQELNALKFTFSSTSKQVGIKSLTVTLIKEAEVVIPVTSFSVSPATKSILVNDDFTIATTILPTDATNKKITWVSSDESVATIVDGVVTGVSAGRATITATVKDTAFSATCTVTVNNRPVTSLTLNKTEAEITVGKDLQLTATINEDATVQTVVWESSDESILTVDSSGKVHAVSEGSAIVTATADGGVTATCSITVNPKQESGGGSVETGTRLFFEPFTGFSAGAQPTALGTNGEAYNDASISYTCNLTGTKIYAESLAGGTSPEILVAKNGGSFVISGLPTAGAEELSFTYKHNNTNNSATCSSAAYSVSGNSGSYTLTLKSGQTAPETITITIANSAGSNTRIDDIALTVSKAGSGGTVTPTPKATLSSISVTGAKTSFTKGDAFVFGGVCTAVYSDGSEKGVTPTEITGYNMNTIGQQTVTVKYTEDGVTQTATYKINVENVVITLSEITVTPSATTFNIGDPFSKPTVTAKYSDGSTLNVTNNASITGYNAQTAGKQTITVSYTEGGVTLTKTYTIEVIDPEMATTGSATIVPTDLQTSYPGSETTFTKSNMTFGYNTVANMSSAGYLQFKKQIGYVRNTVAIAGLRSIEVVVTSGKAFTGTLFSGTTADDLIHEQAVEESGTYYIESGDKFFKLQETGSTAGYLDSITVNYSTKKVNPTSVYFDQSTMDMTLGETAKLTAKFTPDDCNENMGLTWTSSNTSVATVSNGTITAKTKGTTTITATSTYNANFKATCILTVKDIAVTSVSLDATSASMQIGSTKQLYATINPSNATNQNVTWSSTNTTVATVSSTGLVTAKTAGTTTIKVTTADGGKTASCSIEVTEQKMDKWTIMLYICGSDLESDGGYASGDIKEILSTKNKPDDVNIIIQTGGTKSWELSSTYLSGATKIDATKTQRWHVEGSKLVLDETLNKANFGSSSTLQSFYTWGTTSYPAEKTGVIFWNHGGGVDGVCWDENYNDDCLSMSECKSALSGAFGSNPTKKLEWIGYDACLMQVQDIADYNSKYFNYMVASEESESGYGWDYDKWLPYVYNGSATSEVLKQICYTFIAEQGTSSDQTLSYLNLAYMQEYKTAWENFASALKSTLTKNKVSKKTFQTFVNNNVKYYSESGYCGWGNVDAKDLVNKVAANSSYNPGSTYTNAVLTAFNKLVEYSRCGSKAGNSYGLCCVYRVDSNVSYTSNESSFTNWISFNSSFGG